MTKRKTKFKKMAGEERYTASEIPVSQLEARNHEMFSKAQQTEKIIEQSISYLHELNNLTTESFYCIHVNWHCVVTQVDRFDELNKVQIFYPAQLAIAEFNLQKGLLRRFNKFINPILPMGYASEASERKERVHAIPLDNELGESDLRVVYEDMKNFLTGGQANGSIPPLYTRGEDIMNNTSKAAVCSVLKTLYYNAYTGATYTEAAMSGDEWEGEFKVYPLNKLLFELGKIYQPQDMIDISVADLILKKDPYMYADRIATKYLEEKDRIQNCSLSMVSRWPMTIREFCFPDNVQTEKLFVPPVVDSASPRNMQDEGVLLASEQQKQQQQVPEQQHVPHDKLYPAMKAKETPPVQSPSSAPPQQAGAWGNSAPAGSAWARPLVYQAPGSSYHGAAPGHQESGTDNFPPLGGLKISNQQNRKK